METVEKYRVYVQKVIEKQGYFSSHDEVETQIITDEKQQYNGLTV